MLSAAPYPSSTEAPQLHRERPLELPENKQTKEADSENASNVILVHLIDSSGVVHTHTTKWELAGGSIDLKEVDFYFKF